DPSYSPETSNGADYRSKYAMETLRQQLTGQVFFRHGPFSGSISARYQERISYKDYVLGDLRFAYRHHGLETYIDAQNLLDATYTEVAAAPMPGRWIHLGIKYNWTMR